MAYPVVNRALPITNSEPISMFRVVTDSGEAGGHVVMSDPNETPVQRRARYLRLAAEAEASAGRCRGPDLRDAYLALARSWILLARDIKVDSAD